MQLRFVSTIALVVGLAGFTGCSGGSSANSTGSAVASGAAFRVLSCNLGCTSTGCQIQDIAQNSSIIMTFTRDLDPRWVNTATMQFVTASGELPVGQYFVRGPVVEFVPEVLVVGTQTFFGFKPGETYILRMPGGVGEANSIRSTASDSLAATYSCTLNVTRGIIDLNGVPPSAVITSPTAVVNVPRNMVIGLEFNELLDITPFIGTSGSSSPVIYAVRRTRELNGVRECSPNSAPQVLQGAPTVTLDAARSVTRVTFLPRDTLPGNTCVEVTVTGNVRDLSGRAAAVQVSQYITEPAQLIEQVYTEEFDDASQLDRAASAGSWGGGEAVFGPIGGDGRHGTFRADLGVPDSVPGTDGRLVYTINTDNTIVPGSSTITGLPIAVTDGNFYFDQMVVPVNVRLKFSGNSPPRFHVRGRLEVFGVIDQKGLDQTFYDPSFAFSTQGFIAPGQDGSLGGAFGGRGGAGATESTGLANPGQINGLDGSDCRVLSGHAYAGQRVGSAGKGSRAFPVSGLTTGLVFAATTVAYGVQAAAGGGGGGYFVAGAPGRAITNTMPESNQTFGSTLFPPSRGFLGPNSSMRVSSTAFASVVQKVHNTAATPATAIVYGANDATGEVYVGLVTGTWLVNDPILSVAGLQLATVTGNLQTNAGNAFPVFPIPAGAKSTQHFLVGGSGGGGGGSQATFALRVSSASTPIAWAAGAGGAGGGGAIALCAGDELVIGASTPAGAQNAQVTAKGGKCSAAPLTPASVSQAAPGGGGSGGSVVLQSGRVASVIGLVEVLGGVGGTINRSTLQGPPAGANVSTEGGTGATGFIRLELPGSPTISALPNALPPATSVNVAPLTEQDDRSGFRSNFISTGQPFGPDYLRYEIYALVDGVPRTFSDDPAVGQAASFGGPSFAPIEARFQAATMDPLTNQIEANSIRPWRVTVRASQDPSLADDGLNSFRYQIVIDRSTGQTVVIDKVKVIYRV